MIVSVGLRFLCDVSVSEELSRKFTILFFILKYYWSPGKRPCRIERVYMVEACVCACER